MKLGRIKLLHLVVLTTTIILFTESGIAQGLRPEKQVSSVAVAGDANGLAVRHDDLINPDDSARPVRKTRLVLAANTISFLPAEIFVPTKEIRAVLTLHPASVRNVTTSKGVSQGDDNYDPAALAKTLLNPVSSLASLSFRNRSDFALAADREGWRYTMSLEPVIPMTLNKDWNLISRTMLPVVQQDGIVESMVQTGLGDMLQRVLLSPSKTEPFFWGVGATLLLPTATDTHIGAGKLGLGPTLAVGRQHRAWSYGALAHQIWSVAGHRDRADVRSTFIQPFVAYTTRSAWTYSLDTESNYDWVGKQWSIPIHFEVTKVVRFGRQPVSVGGALRCWAATPPGGPQACGVRFVVTPLFPAR
jgi:hypothetical protein